MASSSGNALERNRLDGGLKSCQTPTNTSRCLESSHTSTAHTTTTPCLATQSLMGPRFHCFARPRFSHQPSIVSSRVNLIVSRLSRLQSEDGNLTILVNLANVVTSAPSRGLSLSESIWMFICSCLCVCTLLMRLHVYGTQLPYSIGISEGNLCQAIMLFEVSNGNLLISVLRDQILSDGLL